MAKKPKLSHKLKLGGTPGYGFNLMAMKEHIAEKLNGIESLGISPKIAISDEGELTLDYNLKESMTVGFRGESDKRIADAVTAIGKGIQDALGLGTGMEKTDAENDTLCADLRKRGMLPIKYMSEQEYKEE